MKKGFTLIELLAVIAVLVLIASVVFPAINSAITSSREKAYNDQVAIIEKAAKQWALDQVNNPDGKALPELNSGNQIEVDLSELVDGGYISEEEVIDPRDKEGMRGRVVIKAESGYNQYSYTYVE